MGGSSKASTSTANTQQTQNTQNTTATTTSNEVSGSGSIGLTGSGNQVSVTQVSTDQGAVQAGLDTAKEALGNESQVAQAGLDLGRTIGAGSFDFANEFGTQALNDVTSSTQNGLNAALDFGSKALAANQQTASNTASVLGQAIETAGEQTRSDTADSLNKIALYGAVAVVAIVIAVIAMKGN